MIDEKQEKHSMCANEHQSQPAPIAGSSRRSFLFKLGAALNVVAASFIGIPVIGYVFSSFSRRGSYQSWVSLGALESFPAGQTRLATYRNPYTRPWDGATADIPCWVRRIEGEKFQVFAINCTHLGCPVRWFQESHLYMCPCHGGAFYEDGSHASGPPPRGLYEYQYKIENNQLLVKGGQLPTLGQPL
ncbi:MAG TPA: Rieske (2Fe-2S) protein [Pyrinomonadaceae bacterium]|nr:Rieske (2Fe-2S) protein [Pyrinomonadaceae bacterium]